jgi:hypothetical protein
MPLRKFNNRVLRFALPILWLAAYPHIGLNTIFHASGKTDSE